MGYLALMILLMIGFVFIESILTPILGILYKKITGEDPINREGES